MADRLTADLASVASPERATSEKKYLKSELDHLGASVPQIRAAATCVFRANRDLSHDEVVSFVEALWSEPVHERRMAAVETLVLYAEVLGPADLPLIEQLIRESRTWALVDSLASTVAGGVVAGGVVARVGSADPAVEATLDRWAADPDFWLRRSVLLVFLLALRRGEGDFERFARYADSMIDEREFFIRKAIGWVLREAAPKRPGPVAEFVGARIERIAGLTLREAVKYLPAEDRDRLLAKRLEVGR